MEVFFLEVLLGSNSTSSVSSEEGSGAQLDEIDWRSRLVSGIIRGQEEEDISGESVRLKRFFGIARRLLQWKPELIDKPYLHGWTPLHYTVHRGNAYYNETNYLLAHIRTGDEDDGKIVLHIAAAIGNVGVMKLNLSKCPEHWEVVDYTGCNILHIAAREDE